MKVFLATDHAGFELKEVIKTYLRDSGGEVEDCGAHTYDKDDDYPDFISIAAREVATHPDSIGIIFGKSGAGEAIVANKIKGVRAVVGFNEESVKLSREHNDANVLSLGAGLVPKEIAIELVKIFLEARFNGEERHKRRLDKITQIENSA